MIYIDKQSIKIAFDLIAEFYAEREEIPDYRNEPGFEDLVGILERVQEDVFYPTLLDKATYLMVQINKGHFFSNGNKRLALVCSTIFLVMNGKRFDNNPDRARYRALFKDIFPKFASFEDYPDFSPKEFGLYNLSILIADSSKYVDSFDELKGGVYKFLQPIIIE